MKSKITQALVERTPAPERGKSILHADTEMRGFYLIVTASKRSFYALLELLLVNIRDNLDLDLFVLDTPELCPKLLSEPLGVRNHPDRDPTYFPSSGSGHIISFPPPP